MAKRPKPPLIVQFQFLSAAIAMFWLIGPSEVSSRQSEKTGQIFRSGATHVTLDVVVTDSHDQPVTDLKASDFEITELNRRQTISDFERIDVPLGRREVNLKAVDASPDVADNLPPPRGSRAFVFVVDDGTLGANVIPEVKRAMASFVGTISDQDRAAVVFIRRSDLAQDFTNDPAKLVAAVNKVTVAIGWDPDFKATMNVLENSLQVLATAPQTRKAIIYVAGGHEVSLSPETRDERGNVRGQLELTKDRANTLDLLVLFEKAKRAGIPIYTYNPALAITALSNKRAEMKRQFLLALATSTGGLGFTNLSTKENALRSVQQAIADNGHYYLLGYYPDPSVTDGNFHDVSVKVVTRPGLRVRARPGYVAMPTVSGDTAVPALVAALGDAQPGGDLSLRGYAAPLAPSERGARCAVTLEVGYQDLRSPQLEDELKVAMVVVDPDGKVQGSSGRTMRVPLQGRKTPLALLFDHVLDLPKGKFTLRMAVSSTALGRTGIIHVPLEVPDLKSDGPVMAPIVLGRLNESGVVVQPDAISSLVSFQPTTVRSFRTDDKIRVLARVFGTKLSLVEASVVLRSGALVSHREVVTTARLSVENAVDLSTSDISLSNLASGSYVLEVSARFNKGKSVSRSIPILVR